MNWVVQPQDTLRIHLRTRLPQMYVSLTTRLEFLNFEVSQSSVLTPVLVASCKGLW
jgi:hypothetical protein